MNVAAASPIWQKPIARAAIGIVGAAVLATALVPLLAFGSLERAALIPLPFCLLGSTALALVYDRTSRTWVSRWPPYAICVAVGAIAGTIFLGFIGSSGKTARIGGAYGLATSIFWITLHAATGRGSLR